MDKVISCFDAGRVEDESFVFTGWNLKQTVNGIQLAQNSYVEKMELEDLRCMVEGVDNNVVLDKEKQSKFRRAV